MLAILCDEDKTIAPVVIWRLVDVDEKFNRFLFSQFEKYNWLMEWALCFFSNKCKGQLSPRRIIEKQNSLGEPNIAKVAVLIKLEDPQFGILANQDLMGFSEFLQKKHRYIL